MLKLTYPPNLKCLSSPVTEISNALRNLESGVVRGHPSLSAMSPFDRVHTTSYSALIETIRLSCIVYEI